MIVQPSNSRVKSVILLVAFVLVNAPNCPSFSCACLSSSRRCSQL